MVVEPGEGRRESLWVKSLVVLLVVFIGVPSGVFVYRKWVDWRTQVELERVVYSREVHDLLEESLRREDPNAFTRYGVIKGFEIEKGSATVSPMGGFFLGVIVSGDGWHATVSYGFDRKYGTSGPLEIFTGPNGDDAFYPYFDRAYGKEYTKALFKHDYDLMKKKWGRER